MKNATKTRLAVKHLDHLNLSVQSLEESSDWYARVFDFERVEGGVNDDGTPWAILRAGDAMLCVYEHSDWERLSNPTRRAQGLQGLNHFALRITGEESVWEERLEREGVSVNYGGAIRWPASTSWYVNDPTGYEIEVVRWKEDRVSFAT